MEINEVIAKIRELVDEVDDTKLFYVCKKLGYKRGKITSNSFRILKTMIAYHKAGFSFVTVRMIASILDISSSDTFRLYEALHRLGDYHILLKLRPKEPSLLKWTLHPLFKKAYGIH